MRTLYIVLYVLAAVCFLVGAYLAHRGYGTTRGDNARSNTVSAISVVSLGLLFWVLVPLIVEIKASS